MKIYQIEQQDKYVLHYRYLYWFIAHNNTYNETYIISSKEFRDKKLSSSSLGFRTL